MLQSNEDLLRGTPPHSVLDVPQHPQDHWLLLHVELHNFLGHRQVAVRTVPLVGKQLQHIGSPALCHLLEDAGPQLLGVEGEALFFGRPVQVHRQLEF